MHLTDITQSNKTALRQPALGSGTQGATMESNHSDSTLRATFEPVDFGEHHVCRLFSFFFDDDDDDDEPGLNVFFSQFLGFQALSRSN